MNSVIKVLNYRFYIKEFLILFICYLFMEPIFSWLFTPTSLIVQAHQKVFSFLITGFMLYHLPKLKPAEKVYIGLFTLFILKLMFESMFFFGTVFRQLTMFYVLFPIVFTFFIKYINRTYDLDLLEFIAKFYLITYIVFMVIYGRDFSFNLDVREMDDYGPYSGDGRIIHASSILMMIIPLLWYLHKYVETNKTKFLLPFILCLFIILIHQHRSVWSSSIVALGIYAFCSIRINKKSISRIWTFAFATLALLVLFFVFVSSMFPNLIDFFGERFSEIFDPAKEESTGRFRVEQRNIYFALFLERPIFGWTFEGFEMDNPMVDWWPKNTGQHFHESYMEALFYHGIAGFIFKFSILFYLLYKMFSKKLTEQTIVILSFCISGMLFAFNYVLPLMYWGHVGLALYYIEKDEFNYDQEWYALSKEKGDHWDKIKE